MKVYLVALRDFVLRVVGLVPVHTFRLIVYRIAGVSIGAGAAVHGGAEIRSPRRITIGSRTSVGHRSVLDGRGGLTVGDDVNIGSETMFWTADHDPDDPAFGSRLAPVVVEDLAWIATRAVVLPGITIGRGAVVATGAVVTCDVPAWTIVGGVPARPLGKRAVVDYRLSPKALFW